MNFKTVHQPLADAWTVYDNAKAPTVRRRAMRKNSAPEYNRIFDSVARAMRRGPKAAGKGSRMHGTPSVVREGGKIVERKA
jgi:hypothetical protein